jgi:hypothetical protein
VNGDTSESFLGRWSRNKRAADKSLPEAPPEGEAPPVTSPDPAPEPEAQPITPEELEALPRIEDLVQGSDIRGFLRMGVPRQLRNAALRRMWMLTPAIRDYSDPAVDYAWDWNTPGGVPGDGVGPSAEKAAAMLKELFTPRQDKPAETAPEQPSQTSPEDAKPPAQEAPQEAPKPEDAPAPSAKTAPAADPEPELNQKRRHGSALPS